VIVLSPRALWGERQGITSRKWLALSVSIEHGRLAAMLNTTI
jgi:hypothetical protein